MKDHFAQLRETESRNDSTAESVPQSPSGRRRSSVMRRKSSVSMGLESADKNKMGSLVSTLRRLEVLKSLSSEQLTLIAESMTVVRFQDKETVFRQVLLPHTLAIIHATCISCIH